MSYALFGPCSRRNLPASAIVPSHAMHRRAVELALGEEGLRRVLGHGDRHGQSGACAVGRQRAGGVAGRGRGQAPRAPRCLAIETASAMPRALNEPVGLRASSFTQTFDSTASSGVNPSARRHFVARLQRQHFAIAPQRRRAAREIGECQPHGRQVVIDPQRHAAGGADTQQRTRIMRLFAGEAADAGEMGRQSG